MFGGGDGAAVGMLRKGMGSATKGAYNQTGGALAAVDVVAEAVATGALGEERAAYKWLDGASIDPKEGRGAPLHQFKAGAIGVVKGEDDARSVLAWREVSWVSEPTRWKKDFASVADGVARELACKVLGGGDRAIRAAADRNAADNDMAEACDGDAAGTRAEGRAENVIEDGDVFGGRGAFKGEYEVLMEGVGGRPASREEFEGGVDGVEPVTSVANEFARVHGME